MYALNRLNSAKHIRAFFTAGAGAPSMIQSHRLNPPLGSFALTHSASCRDIDDFVYVGKGYKICGNDEIESSMISDRQNSFKLKCSQKRNKKHTYKRKVLPPKLLSRTVVKLTCESTAEGGMCDVYLVGTSHFCEKSAREAQTVIQYLKPQVVFLELCSSRLPFLTGQLDKVLTMNEILDMWKRNEDPYSILYKWFQSKLGNQSEVVPGGECRVAYKEAMKYGGKVILGDRPYEITERRILANMSAWRYLFHPKSAPVPEDLMKTAKDDLDRINLGLKELSKIYPTCTEPLLHERDRYMSAKILKVARKHKSVVAVVGRGHLAGIQKHWKQPVDVKQLLDTGKFTMGKIVGTFGAMVVFLILSRSQIHKIQKILYATRAVKATRSEREVQGSSPPAPPSPNSDKTKKM